VTEPACPTIAAVEFLDNTELNLLDRDENHLRDSLARLDLVTD
jgi:hypothetical protein